MHTHLLHILESLPVYPAILSGAFRYTLTQSQSLRVETLVVDSLLSRTHNLGNNPWRETAVLHIGDDVLLVARTAERSTMLQLRSVLVIRAAEGENLLGHVALEGTQVSAEYCLKLIQVHTSLGSLSLHGILVQIVAGTVIQIVSLEAWREQGTQNGGLVDAALAHQNQHRLVHEVRIHPCHHHRHEPLSEIFHKLLLGVAILGAVFHRDSHGKLPDVIRLAIPLRQTAQIVIQRIERLAVVAGHDIPQFLHTGMDALQVHLHPDGVQDVVAHIGILQVLGILHHAAHHLILAGNHVVNELVVLVEPLSDELQRSLNRIVLALGVEVPFAGKFAMVLVHTSHHACRVGILLRELGGGILQCLLLLDAVFQAAVGKAGNILVVLMLLESFAPALNHHLDVGSCLLDGWGVAALLLAGLAALRSAALVFLLFVLDAFLGNLQLAGGELQGDCLPVEVGIRVVGKAAESADVGGLLVGLPVEQGVVEADGLLDHGIEEFHDGEVAVLGSVVSHDDADTLSADGVIDG